MGNDNEGLPALFRGVSTHRLNTRITACACSDPVSFEKKKPGPPTRRAEARAVEGGARFACRSLN